MTVFDTYINKLPADIITALKNTPQDPKWHPEGNVYNHVKLVFNAVLQNHHNNLAMLHGAIFHDLGKIDNTKTIVKNGKNKIVAYGHEFKSLDYVDKYFHLYSDDDVLKDKVKSIVKNHMRAHLFASGTIKKQSKIDAFKSLPDFKDIMDFSVCDDMGKQFS